MAIGIKVVNGDFVINNSGTLDLIGPSDKCSRDFGKMLSTKTEYVGNETSFYRYNPSYGTQLDNNTMFSGMHRDTIKDVIILLLNEAMSDYLKLQESRGNLSIEEVITGVRFDAYYDPLEPAILRLDIKYSTIIGDDQSPGTYMQRIV